MSSRSKPPRKSAAIILTRSRGDSTEVYLVRRSPELAFFGGYYAFPGGVIDPEEARQGGERGFERCAIRELFEETGVGLHAQVRALSVGDRESLRRDLLESHGAQARWSEVVGEDEGELTRVLEITTPPFSPRRYETVFFTAELPPEADPIIWPGELDHGMFLRPADALLRWRRGEILIAPPVLFLLEILDEHGLDRFAAVADAEGRALREGRLHPVRYNPGIFVAPLEARTKPPATTTNCFLVGHERLYVVDPAPTKLDEQARLLAKIDSALHSGVKLEAVLVTHAHPDHVGAVRATAERYGVRIGGHPLALESLEQAGHVPLGTTTFELNEGDELDLGSAPDGTGEWTLRVLHTPGHSPDHLAFVESRYRSAILGDLVSSVSTVLIDPPEGHLRTYLGTLDRLRSESVATVYPSHGPAVRTGAAMLERFVAHRLERIRAIQEFIRADEPEWVDIERVVGSIYHDVQPAVVDLARRSLAASLEYLEEDGSVVIDGERVRWSGGDSTARVRRP
ncbi:MAG: MBL fold metallo-hydrolase [Planctomycetes bacterium]|nr:MBL fold metallo-hydrolase [Planctomycetota bacterium]